MRGLGVRPWHVVFFLLALAVCGALLAPVSLVVRQIPGHFTYERAEGTIWRARFVGARAGSLDAGAVDWRLDPAVFLKGAVGGALTFEGKDIRGDLTIWYGSSGVQRLGAKSLTIQGAAPVSPLLQGVTTIDGLEVAFVTGACTQAVGVLRSDVPERSARILGGSGPVLTGAAICGDGELWLPLEGATGAERFRVILALRQNGEARWQADVVPGSVEKAGALAVVGFRPVPEEPYLRQTRTFRWLPS